MAGVIWHSVSLTGFGPYAEKTTYTFPPGLGVLVAPNESGKSTLVAGLMATLYGLPTGGSPSDFGQTRYRHLGRAPGFEGEVEFTAADGLRYHVWRDFGRHQVVVTRHGPAGPERIYQGTHNPGARTGREPYENLITGLVGLTSRELLAAIFCLTQPLPEMEQVDHSVQELLAGAGGGRPQQALERLAEEAAKWTRYPAEYGFPTNMRKDRELEALQARIRDLAAQIEQARSAVDLYHRSAGHLQAVEAQYEEVRREAAQRRQVLDALQEWQRLAERRRQHRRQVGSLRRALESARDAARQVDELRGRLAREWPELAALPADTGDRLQALIGLEEDLARRAQEAADLERQRRESEQAAEEAEARLRSEFGDVAGRAALPRDVRELRARLAELKRLEARLADLAAEEARLTARLSAGPDWGELGRPAGEAVRRLRTVTDEALHRWERYERLREKVALAAAALERYAVFAGQPQEVLDLVRRFHVLEAEARRQAEVAAARAGDLDRQLQRLDAEAGRLRQDYAAVAGLDEAVIAAAREKVALLQQQDQVRERLAEARKTADAGRKRAQGLAAAAGLLLGFGLGWLAGRALLPGSPAGGAALPGAAMAAAAVLALLGGGLGYFLGGRMAGGAAAGEARALERRQRELAAQIAALNLGPLSAEPPLRLNLLVQQWEEWRRRWAALEEERRALTDSPEKAALREAAEQARRELDALAERLRPFTARFADPAAALAEWENLRRDQERDRADLDELCQAEWGVAPEQVEELALSALRGRWAELAKLARIAARARLSPTQARAGTSPAPAGGDGLSPELAGGDGPSPALAGGDGLSLAPSGRAGTADAGSGAPTADAPARLAELVRWLRAATPSWWERVIAEAGKWSADDQRLAEVRAERRRLEEAGPDGRSSVGRLKQEVEALRAQVAPFDEQADPDELEARVAAAGEVRAQAERARAAAKTLQERERQVAGQQSALAEQAEALRRLLAPALAAAGGDPRAALERWRAREQALRQVQEGEKELSGILTASGAADLEDLDGRLTDAELEWRRTVERLEALAQAHPGLPSADEADDPLAVQGRIQELREEQQRTETRLEQLEAQRRALRDQLQDLGRETINLAEAEMRLAELRREEQKLVRKVRALGIAYQELGEAVRVYRTTYRERLEAAATEYWAGLTGRSGRRVRLSDEFTVSVVEPDGVVLTPPQLSKGAQDQLYLALRLAIGDLIAEEVRLPFVFDDPFLNCDEERLAHIRKSLDRLAEERQVLLLSHREEFAAWGSPVV